MKHGIVEIYEDKFGDHRFTYVCEEASMNGFIYTDPKLNPHVKLFDTEAEALGWGNQNLAPTSTGSNVFKAIEIDTKDIFVARLKG